jgi:hypothetical protein
MNSYRCRHVIVVKVGGRHSISRRRRQHWSSFIVAVPYGRGSCRHQWFVERSAARKLIITVADMSSSSTREPFPVVVDSIGRRSSSPFHTGAAQAIVIATVERSTA